ncbi:hypothetical protein BDA96_02G422000 [Sorghum bicolor]|jgi:hypothetical protein|uniref:Uncharacterized protein n=2 Tax=Sorghum bicolor TaxID=4558 RepID=A0A921RUF6_SORBI|nr:hypothetical protein BDA96_02G422000 [Sorghum bicolor]OQU90398.1 hypothetical protein SORBI_3002G401533 [Sorghum bicolor]
MLLLKIVRMLQQWIQLFKQEMGAQVRTLQGVWRLSKLSASTTMEDGHGDIIIRVGTIGCSAFGYKCSVTAE